MRGALRAYSGTGTGTGTSGGNSNKKKTSVIHQKLEQMKRRIHHAILIYNEKIPPHKHAFYAEPKNNEMMLIGISEPGDTETPSILYTGLSPVESNLFDIRFFENYVTIGNHFINWLFRRTPPAVDESNCVYHFPKIPASENSCSSVLLNELPSFTPIVEPVCEFTNSQLGWLTYLFFYLTNDLLCIIIGANGSANAGFSGLSIFLYDGGLTPLPSNVLFCLILRVYWGVWVALLLINLGILVTVLFITLCCSCLCTQCIFGIKKTNSIEAELHEFRREMNQSLAGDLHAISARIDKNVKNYKELVEVVSTSDFI